MSLQVEHNPTFAPWRGFNSAPAKPLHDAKMRGGLFGRPGPQLVICQAFKM